MNSTDATSYPAPLGMPAVLGTSPSPVTVGVARAPFGGTGLPALRRRATAMPAPIGGTAARSAPTPLIGGTVQHERTTPGDLPPRDPLSQ